MISKAWKINTILCLWVFQHIWDSILYRKKTVVNISFIPLIPKAIDGKMISHFENQRSRERM